MDGKRYRIFLCCKNVKFVIYLSGNVKKVGKMMKKLRKLSNKGKITLIVFLAVLVIGGVAGFFLTRSPISFKENVAKVEINGSFDADKNIEKVSGGSVKDVEIDTSKVDYSKLGKYPIIYKYNDKKYEVTVEIVDTVKPKFDVVDIDVDLGMEIDPASMATNIVDATKTKVTFKEDYDFSKEGKVKVVVQVIDEGDNVTEKKGTVTLVKDVEAPVINGLSDLLIALNEKNDYKTGITVSNNRDPEPKLEIDSSAVNNKKLGTYKVKYIATDRSGNKVEKTRNIKVVENKEIGTTKQSDEKIVYLTFDDGPSANTQKILDILDNYGAKATFFVTGNNKPYNHLIKTAHDKGHTIALHTYCHDYKTVYASVDAYFDDLTKVGNMVKDIIGTVPKYVRFPGGSSNTVSKKYCPGIMTTLSKELINRGYQYYDWNGDSTDASGNNVAVSKLVANATSSKSNNINILFHDTDAKGTTVQALPAIIENYRARGYRFEAINDSSFVPHQGINN